MAARSGMTTLVQRVRDLGACGTADYTVGTATYWTDDQIQTLLDRNRREIFDEQLENVSQVDSGGTAEYLQYYSIYDSYEETTGGTAIFYLRDSTGTRVGTADYTPDYDSGKVLFGSDTGGSAYWLTGRSYDVYAAAAEVWEAKAASVADRYDFSADGASFKAGQLVDHYMAQAARMRSRSTTGGISTHTFVRSDIVA